MAIPTPPIPGNIARPTLPNQNIPAAPAPAATRNIPMPTPATPSRNIPSPHVPSGGISNIAPPSCKDCIFYIPPTAVETQTRIIGKSVGGAICAKREMFLTNVFTDPTSDNILEGIARGCSEFDTTGTIDSHVMRSVEVANISFSPTVRTEVDNQGYSMDPISDCQSCIFFNSESETIDKAGLPVKSCSRRNIAIRDEDTESIGQNCYMSAGVNNVDAMQSANVYVIETHAGTAPITMAADNSDDSTGNAVSGRGRRRAIDPASEPDKAATTEDMAMGIRGWRKVVNQADTSMTAYLPIFNPQHFDADQRAMIPMTGDDEHPEDYQDHQNLLYKTAGLWGMGMTPAVNGIPGTGKTEFFRYAAWVMQLPFVRLSIDNRTEKDDLAGKMHVSPEKGTYFKYGRLTSQWSKPCVMLVDEPNTGPDEVWQFLRPLTDNSKQLVLDTNEGERIQKHQHNFLGMAFNPAWDMRNVGTHDISAADVSRLMHIQVTPPTPSLEKKIVQKACKHVGFTIPDDKLEKVMNIAKDIRELSENDFPLHWGVREQIKVARVLSFLDMRDAYRMAIADFLDPDQAEQIFQIVRAHDGVISQDRPRRGRPPGSRNRPRN